MAAVIKSNEIVSSVLMTESLQPQKLGVIIDAYRALYDERAELNAQSKELTQQMEELEAELIKRMDEAGLDSAKGKCASLRLEEKSMPNVADWDQVYNYIKENEAWYLLERRVTQRAYQELVQSGEVIPGINTYTLRRVATRAI